MCDLPGFFSSGFILKGLLIMLGRGTDIEVVVVRCTEYQKRGKQTREQLTY